MCTVRCTSRPARCRATERGRRLRLWCQRPAAGPEANTVGMARTQTAGDPRPHQSARRRTPTARASPTRASPQHAPTIAVHPMNCANPVVRPNREAEHQRQEHHLAIHAVSDDPPCDPPRLIWKSVSTAISTRAVSSSLRIASPLSSPPSERPDNRRLATWAGTRSAGHPVRAIAERAHAREGRGMDARLLLARTSPRCPTRSGSRCRRRTRPPWSRR